MDRRLHRNKETENDHALRKPDPDRARGTGVVRIRAVAGTGGRRSKQELDAHVHQAIQDLYRSNLVAKDLAGKAAGMLVFPTIIKAGFWVGGEYGEGALLAGQSIVAYYNIVAASFGLQVGVQDESLAIMFMTSEALNKFRASKGWKIGVDGSVAVVTVGVGGVIGQRDPAKADHRLRVQQQGPDGQLDAGRLEDHEDREVARGGTAHHVAATRRRTARRRA